MDCKSENIGNAIPDIAGVGIILAFAILAGLSLVFAGIGYYITLQAKSIHPDASGDENSNNDWEAKRAQFFRVQRLDLTEKVLGSISEVQLFNGIALLIAAMVQRNSLSLYHLHVVYDTVNFTAVSFTASMFVVWLSRKMQKGNGENGLGNSTRPEPLQIRRLPWMTSLVSTSLWIIVFCILYLVYAVLFGIALGRWDVEKFGYCYRDRGITSPHQRHPEADHVYLSITCLYMFGLLSNSYADSHRDSVLVDTSWPISIRERHGTLLGPVTFYEKKINDAANTIISYEKRARDAISSYFLRIPGFSRILSVYVIPPSSSGIKHLAALQVYLKFNAEFALVCIPLAQFLLHLYMVWAIRSANRMHLQGESEDTWGFGQVVALVQILPILKGCTKDCMDYRIAIAKWNNEHGESGRTQTRQASPDGRVAVGECDLESSG